MQLMNTILKSNPQGKCRAIGVFGSLSGSCQEKNGGIEEMLSHTERDMTNVHSPSFI